jgi:hypothetical protein
MKYHRIVTACGLVLLLVICAFTLGGCELFFEKDPPPRLVVRNKSLGLDDISKIEFWVETPEAREAGEKMALAFLKLGFDWNVTHLPEHLKEIGLTMDEYAKATSTIIQNPPLLLYDTVISYEESCSFDLDSGKSYVTRINGKVLSSVSIHDTGDTVYVFNGSLLKEE